MGRGFGRRAGDKKLQVLAFLSMGSLYVVSYFHRVAVPGTIFNEMQSSFGASAGQITALAAIYLYVYASMQLVVGVCADRFGATKPLLIGGAVLSVGAMLFPLAPGLKGLYLARALVGLGGSVTYLCYVKEIDRLFGARHFAPLLGFAQVFGYVGALAAGTPLRMAVEMAGWRGPMLAVAGLGAAAVAAAGVLLPRLDRQNAHGAESTFSWKAVKQLFANRRIYPSFVSGPLMFGTYWVFQATIGQKFLQDFCGVSGTYAAGATSAMTIVVLVGSFFSGFLPQLIGHRRKPIVVGQAMIVLLSCAGLTAGVMHRGSFAWFAGCYLLLALAPGVGAVGTCIIKEINPRRVTAFAIGFSNCLTYFVVAGINSGVGFVLDHFRDRARFSEGIVIYPAQAYLWMFGGLLALSAVAIAATLLLPETRGEQVEDEAMRETPVGSAIL